MTEKVYNVLLLCTGNSARSILGEALLNHLGKGRFKAYSAGSHPAGKVNPFALELLEKNGIDTARMRSKSWSEFEAPGAPPLDFVFTVCDSAVQGSDAEKRKAFSAAYALLHRRISLLADLSLDSLDRAALRKQLADIGNPAIAKQPS